MAEPLKNLYSKSLINAVAEQIRIEYSSFDVESFERKVLSDGWDKLELKARMRRLSEVLGRYLPQNYKAAIDILKPVSSNFSGLEHMFFPDFVEVHGLDHVTTSLDALQHFTANSSSEFAIRPFILHHPKRTMKQMKLWSKSSDKHLRRIASEGCRPRLPWAMALPAFKQDPAPVLDIILNLLDDESLYVRRSVANNLNDISKDNPETVIAIAETNLGMSKQTDWVVKHACRGLLKKGDARVLPLFGFNEASHVELNNFQVSSSVIMGEALPFKFEIQTSQEQLGKLRLEFLIEFVKANGKTAGKVFKIAEGDYNEDQKLVAKSFSFKPISTRKYYPGTHRLSVLINGNSFASQSFELVAESP